MTTTNTSRPGLLARLRSPQPAETVAVELVGTVHAVTAIARALASVTVVTGMTHRATTEAQIRLRITCYPTRTPGGGR